MRKTTILLILVAFSLTIHSQESNLKNQIKTLTDELESIYTSRPGINIAILEFRTSENKLVAFNNFCRDEVVKNLQNSMNFKLIDPVLSASIAKEKKWNNEVSENFEFFDDLGRTFMEKTGNVPVAYIYGIITDNNESVTITAYMASSGLPEAKLFSSITLDATDKTDKLLEKVVTHSASKGSLNNKNQNTADTE